MQARRVITSYSIHYTKLYETVAAFNELWYRKAPRHRPDGIESIPAYFHPLDLVGGWNRVYGRQGFLQYQFVVPFEAESVMRRVIERISAALGLLGWYVLGNWLDETSPCFLICFNEVAAAGFGIAIFVGVRLGLIRASRPRTLIATVSYNFV